jgi:opacity protein-like surface antigen
MKRFLFVMCVAVAGLASAQTPAIADRVISLSVLDKTAPAKPVKQFKAAHDWTLGQTLKFAGGTDKNQTLAISCGGYNPKMTSLPLQFDVVSGGTRTENLKGLSDKDTLHAVCMAKAKALNK